MIPFGRSRARGLGQAGGFRASDAAWLLAVVAIAAALLVPDYYAGSGVALRNIAAVEKDLSEMRRVLETYRTDPARGAGAWPEKLASIKELLPGRAIPSTPPDEGATVSGTAIREISDARPLVKSDFTGSGGWIYAPGTGELRANLRADAWGASVEWLMK